MENSKDFFENMSFFHPSFSRKFIRQSFPCDLLIFIFLAISAIKEFTKYKTCTQFLVFSFFSYCFVKASLQGQKLKQWL